MLPKSNLVEGSVVDNIGTKYQACFWVHYVVADNKVEDSFRNDDLSHHLNFLAQAVVGNMHVIYDGGSLVANMEG